LSSSPSIPLRFLVCLFIIFSSMSSSCHLFLLLSLTFFLNLLFAPSIFPFILSFVLFFSSSSYYSPSPLSSSSACFSSRFSPWTPPLSSSYNTYIVTHTRTHVYPLLGITIHGICNCAFTIQTDMIVFM
jgi:hypothetical protein